MSFKTLSKKYHLQFWITIMGLASLVNIFKTVSMCFSSSCGYATVFIKTLITEWSGLALPQLTMTQPLLYRYFSTRANSKFRLKSYNIECLLKHSPKNINCNCGQRLRGWRRSSIFSKPFQCASHHPVDMQQCLLKHLLQSEVVWHCYSW